MTNTVIQIVRAENLDYEIEQNVAFGHSILAIVPTSLYDSDVGVLRVKEYKIIMLDCRR